jgi:hypothetical protein
MKLHKLMQALQQIHQNNDVSLETAMNADGNLVLYNNYTTYVIDLDLSKISVSDTPASAAPKKQSFTPPPLPAGWKETYETYETYETSWGGNSSGLPSTSSCQAKIYQASIYKPGFYTVSCLGHVHFKSQVDASAVPYAWEKHLESVANLKKYTPIAEPEKVMTPKLLTQELKKYNLPGALGCTSVTTYDATSDAYLVTCKAHQNWKAKTGKESSKQLTKLWTDHVKEVAEGKFTGCVSKITPPKGNVAKGWWKVECLKHDWQADALPNSAVEKQWQAHVKVVAQGKWKAPEPEIPTLGEIYGEW